MASFYGRRHWSGVLGSVWRRFAVLVLIAAVVVLACVGVGVYALVHGFGPSVGAWTRLPGTSTLPLEESYLATYDSQVGKQIRIFGEIVPDAAGSIWAFDPATGTSAQLPVSGSVPTSGEVGLVYDETSGTVIRIGVDATDVDTWSFDLSTNTWTELHPTWHPAMPQFSRGVLFGSAAVAYDPGSGTVILLGHTGVNSNTWAYDSRANTWTELLTNGSPPARIQAVFAYDKSIGQLLLFGGFGHFEKADGGLLNDTWAFDSASNTWSELRPMKPPAARAEAAMAYDDASSKLILFGGDAGNATLLSDTWAYDGRANTWTRLRTAGAPSPRGRISMFYDPASRRLIVTGGKGKDEAVPTLSDSWAFAY